jgi:hypothetical protein
MSTNNVRIADHMRVDPNTVTSQTGNSGRFDGQISQHVSMVGANTVALTLTVHVSLSSPHSFDMIVQQSNDESNWFEAGKKLGITDSDTLTVLSVSMAWVRVVFILNDSTPNPPSTSTVVTCDLTTSLT